MQKLYMCAVYDSKVGAFMTPMFFQSTGQAIRSFSDAVNTKDSDFARHPEDYGLFELGTFESGSGMMELVAQPKSLGLGATFVVESDR